MEHKVQEILVRWLEIDFYNVANKIGFITESKSSDKELVMSTIRCLDYATTNKSEKNINIIITLIALMWTYSSRNEYDLKAVIIKFLSRIGYPTSAIIVDDMFDKENCQFSAIASLMDQITIGLNQVKNEVIINEHSFLLTDFQKKIWDAICPH